MKKNNYKVYLPRTSLLTSVCAVDMKAWGEDLEEYSQTCAKSHTWNGKDTAAPTWLRRLKRVNFLKHLSLRMLKSSHTESSVDAWTSYLRASLVSPSHRQAFGRELKTQDTSSPSLQTEFGFANQTGSHSKTSKGLSVVSSVASRTRAFSNMSWQEWKKLVTRVRSHWSVRVKKGRRTSESVSSCSSGTQTLTLKLNEDWGTPKEQDSRACLTDRGKSNLGEQVHGLHVQGKLSTNGKNQESSWPTPRTGKTDGTPESERNRQSKSLSAIALTEEATIQSKGVSGKAWATPSTMDTLPPKTGEALARNKKKGGCKNLREDVVNPEMNPEIMYPTPRTVDAEGGLAPNVSVENGRFVRTNAKGEKYSPKLRDAVETMEAWATPQASDHVEGARTSTDSNQKCLGRDMARLSQWGTPAVYDHVKNPASEVNSNQASIARNLGRLSIHGKLNPSWVESLMGLPKNTTLLPKSWLSECQDLDS